MPSAVTHNYFAQKVYKLLPEKIKSIIDKDTKAFLVGSQGPDILFYLRFEKPPINTLGSAVHMSFDTAKLFSLSGEYARERGSDALNAFLLGQLCHYALDKNAHPYVHHRENDLPNFYPPDAKENIHVIHESGIDYLFVRDYLKKNTAFFKGYKALRISKASAADIGEYYNKVVAPFFGMELSPKKAAATIKYMCTFLRLADDTTGIRYLILRGLEKLFRQPRGLSAFVRPRKEKKEEDWLNKNRSPYPASRGKEETVNYTFDEMIENASRDAVKLIENFVDFSQGGAYDASLYTLNYSGDFPS